MTGTSTGLGRAAAVLFAKKGWNVIATMRDPSKAGDLAQVEGVTVLRLDVSDPNNIQEVATDVLSRGPVDVVFNNAGYGLTGPFESATDAHLVDLINTNLLGVMRVTKAFIPAFRARKQGLFVATTSIGGHVTIPFNSVYHASKWGLEGFCESLAYELAPHGISVKTVAPGGINTEFFGRSLVLTQHGAYDALMTKMLTLFRNPARAASYSTPEAIAEVVFEAVTDGKDQVAYIAGPDAKAMFAQRLAVGAEAFRKGIAQMFLG